MAQRGDEPADAAIHKLWRRLDVKNEGFIDAVGLKRGLRKIDHREKPSDGCQSPPCRLILVDQP